MIARRHAGYYRALFERAEAEAEARPGSEWLAEYGREIDNLRAALDWAFSPEGDASIGAALTAAAVPLWVHLSLMEECRSRAEQALSSPSAETRRDARRAMKLNAALAASLLYTRGDVPEIGAAWKAAFDIAEGLGDAEYQLRSLRGLYFFHAASCRYRYSLTLAQNFRDLAANRPERNDVPLGELMIGISQHFLGDQTRARHHIEHALGFLTIPGQRSQIVRFQTDSRIAARVFLARIHWLQGFPDQAMRTAQSSVAEARATGHAMSLCYALAWAACPVAFLTGDLSAAEQYVEALLDYSTGHGLALWRGWAHNYQGVLVIKRGDPRAGLRLLRSGFDELGDRGAALLRSLTFMGDLAAGLGGIGQIAEGLAAIDAAIAQSERTEEYWILPELLRAKGELLLLHGNPEAAAAAEGEFRQALDWAHRQGSLSWELRAAMSLARLLRGQARPGEARDCLAPVYNRFSEGFGAADLVAATRLLAALNNAAGA